MYDDDALIGTSARKLLRLRFWWLISWARYMRLRRRSRRVHDRLLSSANMERHDRRRVFDVSYSMTLYCGCTLRVRQSDNGRIQTRTLLRKHGRCTHSRHREGGQVFLWDLLPEHRARWADGERISWLW